MTAPTWSNSEQGDLLELVALGTAHGSADDEWEHYVWALRTVAADAGGLIHPNRLRPLVRDRVAPRRIGAFTNRALSQQLVAYTGQWEISDDLNGRNAGKPSRIMRWIGEQ